MKKAMAKELRKVASELPIIMRSSKEIHFVKGAELIEQGITTVQNPDWKEGDPEVFKELPVDPTKEYVQPIPVQIAMNHHRKLKKVVKSHGLTGVLAYCDAVVKAAGDSDVEVSAHLSR